MAYTLADHQRLAPDDLVRGVVEVWRRDSVVMDLMTFERTDQLSIQALRGKTLPSVSFRKVGDDWSESKGTVEPVQENIYDLGGYIDVDKLLVKSKTVVDERALQTDMYLTALAYEFQDYFINGNPTVDADGFTGLWYRIKNYHSSQEKNASGLDVSPDAASLAANQSTLIDYIQELIHKLEGHMADAIFSNDTFLLRMMSALRASGLLDTTQDNYGRWVNTYGPNGPKLYDIGYQADQSTKIVGNVETTDGTAKTGGTATSAFAVRFGKRFLMGLELYGIDAQDMGLLENGHAYRTVVDWPIGLYLVHPRSIAQLSGVVAA